MNSVVHSVMSTIMSAIHQATDFPALPSLFK
jgi:hypothetical protein